MFTGVTHGHFSAKREMKASPALCKILQHTLIQWEKNRPKSLEMKGSSAPTNILILQVNE